MIWLGIAALWTLSVEGDLSRRVITWTFAVDTLQRRVLEGAFPALEARPYIPYLEVPLALPGEMLDFRVDVTWIPADLAFIPELQVDGDGLDLRVVPWDGPALTTTPTPTWHMHRVGAWPYLTLRIPLARLREGRYEVVSRVRAVLRTRPRPAAGKAPPPFLARTVVNPEDLRPAPLPEVLRKARKTPPVANVWVRMAIPRTGWYALTGKDLQAVGLEGLRLDALAVYTTGGDTLDGRLPDPFAGLRRVPVEVRDGGQPGVLDEADTLFFFAEGPARYRYREGAWRWFAHPYTDTVYAWLGIGGEASPAIPEVRVEGEGTPLEEGIGFFRHEVNQINLARKGLRWEGEEFFRASGVSRIDTALPYSLEAPPRGPAEIRFAFVSARNYPDYREIRWRIGNEEGGDSLHARVTDRCVRGCVDTVDVLPPSGEIVFSLRWYRPEEDLLYLDYVELVYPRDLTLRRAQELWVFDDRDTGRREIRARGDIRWILDVSDPFQPRRVGGLSRLGEEVRFVWDVDTTTRLLAVATPYRPASLGVEDLGTLWRVSEPADYVILYPEALASAVGPYIQWRRERIPVRQPDGSWVYRPGRVVAYAVEDVFRSFGFGVRDPVAIRNFLVYLAQQNLIRVGETFVLLLGDGHYDYRGFTDSGPNGIPPYEPFEAVDVNEYYLRGAWDEFYVDLDASGGAISGELFVGRLPVRTPAEVLDYLDLLRRYERGDIPGMWRNRVVLVADDEYADNRSTEAFHTVSSDRVYHRFPPSTEVVPVYLIQFPRAQRSQDGQDALVQAFNEGSLFLNFFGHGNPVTITHENILPPQAYARLRANHRPTVAVFASCKVGAYDRVDPRAVLGEVFLLHGVAVATISSSALSFAFANEVYVLAMVDALLRGPLPLGELYLYGKNQRYYLLLGDPAVLFRFPRAAPWTVDLPDTLEGGQAFSYRVSGAEGDTGALVSLRVPPRETTYVGGTTIAYTRPAWTLFTGPSLGWPATGEVFVPILGEGVDSLEFVAVAAGGERASGVVLRPYRLSGIVPVGEGPEVEGWLDGQPLREDRAVQVPQRASLRLILRDPEGIARQGGVRVEALGTRWDLSGYLQFSPGDYREARVEEMLELPVADSLVLVVQATDNVGQVSVRRYPVRVLEGTGRGILSFLPYPNPWRRGGGPVTFAFVLGSPGRVTLKVFALNGKEVYRFPERFLEAGYHQVQWWGQTQGGQRLAGGVYVALLVWKNGRAREQKTTGIFVVP